MRVLVTWSYDLIDGGFGFTRDESGRLVKKPHHGGVIIDKDVEIAQSATINRGSYRDTFIGEGTKIDENVHVGHNTILHKHILVVAHAVIGGSCEIGDYSYIGMGALIKDHVRVGKHCLVGAGSVVTHDIPDGTCVYGNPAKAHKPNLSPQQLYDMIGLYDIES